MKPAPLVVTVHGELYDLTNFVGRHPGGRLPLQLAAGGDATPLFEAYHSDPERLRTALGPYRVNAAGPPAPPAGPFARALSARTADYFRTTGRGPKASRGRRVYYAVITAAYLVALAMYWAGYWGAVPAAVGLGWLVMGMGHDGAHFAVARRPWPNRLAALGLLTNVNALVWYYHHTAGHHVRTNDPTDPDHHIAYPFVRTSPDQPHRWWHRWQVLLIPIYMGLTTLLLAIAGPPVWLARRRAMGSVHLGGARTWMWAGWASWAATVGAIVVVPVICLPWWKAAAFAAAYLFGSGFLFALHVTASHLEPGCFGTIGSDSDWARHQAATARNWRSGCRWAGWVSNGVNHQIEHHLFPGVNPEHYPGLSPIVRAACTEFGVPYGDYSTFAAFLWVAVRWLWALGRTADPGHPPDAGCGRVRGAG